MRHKSTVYNREEHRQFGETPDEIKKNKEKRAKIWEKEEKEGQSDYRKKLATRGKK